MIYCVEDEANIQELIMYALRTAGFDVEGFSSASELETGLSQNLPEMILLDIMLPEKDGLSILKEIRENNRTKHIPVILITAKTSEYDKIKGLDLGADDYISKPIAVMEMISRVKAVMRRCSPQTTETSNDIITVSNISIHLKKRTVSVNGKEVILSFREFELLCFLMENQGIVFSRDNLLTTVWGYEYTGESRTVDVHVRTLRQKIGDDGSLIQTVRNVGYKIGEEN